MRTHWQSLSSWLEGIVQLSWSHDLLIDNTDIQTNRREGWVMYGFLGGLCAGLCAGVMCGFCRRVMRGLCARVMCVFLGGLCAILCALTWRDMCDIMRRLCATSKSQYEKIRKQNQNLKIGNQSKHRIIKNQIIKVKNQKNKNQIKH